MAISNKTLVAVVMTGLMVVSAGSAMAGGRNSGCYPKSHCSPYFNYCYTPSYGYTPNYCYTPSYYTPSYCPTPVVSCDPYKHDCGPGSLAQLQALIAARMAQSANVVVGTWRTTPAEGIELAITLNANRTFAWAVTADGKTNVLSGKYTVTGSDLTLISGSDGDAIRGTIVANPTGAINLAFANPTDAAMALTFNR